MDFPETRAMRDDDEYWNSLAVQVAREAVNAGDRGNGLLAFTGSPLGWVAAAALVVVAIAISGLSRVVLTRPIDAELARALRPRDQVGLAITADALPPSIGALILSGSATDVGKGR